jgi:hypothetical protein
MFVDAVMFISMITKIIQLFIVNTRKRFDTVMGVNAFAKHVLKVLDWSRRIKKKSNEKCDHSNVMLISNNRNKEDE